MKIKVLKNGNEGNIEAPKRDGDVGYDMRSANVNVSGVIALRSTQASYVVESVELPLEEALKQRWLRVAFIEYDTGVVIAPEGAPIYGEIVPNSRNTKMDLILGNSVGQIDPGYRGTIRFRYFYRWQPDDLRLMPSGYIEGKINPLHIYKVGEVCGQIKFSETLYPQLEVADTLTETDRGDGAFGHTGK